MADKISIRGARVHNLKNIDLDIPRDRLVVLSDRSWITDLGRYDADQDLFTPAEGAQEPEGYVETVMAAVNDKFTYSTRILEQDYYGKLGLTDGWQEVYAPAPRLPEKTFHLP